MHVMVFAMRFFPMRNIIAVGFFVLLTVMSLSPTCAQNKDGRWAIGISSGINAWINDFNKHPLAFGLEGSVRYGFTPSYSLGFVSGFEVLKGNQDPSYPGFYEYLRLESVPVSLVSYFNLTPGQRVSTTLYAGVGALFFLRKYYTGEIVPDGKSDVSLVVPFGLSVEYSANDNVGVFGSLSYQITNDETDLFQFQSPDAFLSLKLGVNLYFGNSDSDDDDGDGLSNNEERSLGTNPRLADTDGDRLSDGDEVNRYGANPLISDTDGDGLSDGDEVVIYRTDPLKVDTDNDGLSDGDEIMRYNTDPLKADTDGDGLKDGEEVKLNTNPWNKDSDNDGLTDWDEANLYKTNPNKADSDDDGLSDFDELKKYLTNPLKADSDGGGVIDGVEVARGTNPLLGFDDLGKDSIILERGRSVVLDGVNFLVGSATLTSESERILQNALKALNTNPSLNVEIVGHTDNTGGVEINRQISFRRAESVRAWLVRNGISPKRLTVSGKGAESPIASNTTPEGRARNRRIEFRVR